ncbi:MAG: chromosome segregation protein SMC [Candidatus Cloacimonadia bacterium]
MRLIQLDLAGFKSFADPTIFRFAPGITGIIGPNGCGKSNICDALHWVLGEQNPSRIRGNSMRDVIFNGSKKRSPQSLAEVSIVIENNRQILPLEYKEVKITRRMYQDGESEFYINEQPCRLKDILNLFYDTGMGRRAYSLMEQGMIDSMLSSNDEERRYLFEESAGIMKYNKSRQASENKLKSIQNDLVRLNDIIAEVKHQVNSLRHQVSKTKRYQNLKKKINTIEIQLAGIQFFEYQQKLTPFQNELLSIEEKLASTTKELTSTSENLSRKNSELLETEHRLRQEQEKLAKIEKMVNEYERDILLSRQQLSAKKTAQKEIIAKIDQMKSHDREADRILQEKRKELKVQAQKLEEERTIVEEYAQRLQQITEKSKELQRKADEINQKIQKDSTKRQDLIAQKQSAYNRINFLNTQAESLLKKIEYTNNDKSKIKTSIENLQKKIKCIEEELGKIEIQKRENHSQLDSLVTKEKELSDILQNIQLEIKALEAEKKQLTNWEKQLFGYEDGIQALFSQFREKGELSILGDNIKVDEKYILPVERALQSLISSVLCNEKVVVPALDFLHENRYAAQLILTQENETGNQTPTKIADAIPLLDVLTIKNNNINPQIFQNIYIIKDRMQASQLAKSTREENQELLFITPEGEVFTNRGVIRVNSDKNESEGLLSRKKRLTTIQFTLKQKKNYASDIEKELEEVGKKREKFATNHTYYSDKLQELKKTQVLLEQELKQSNIQSAHLQERTEEYNSSLKSIKDDIKALEQKIAYTEKELKLLPSMDTKLSPEQDTLQSALAEFNAQERDIQEKFNKSNIIIARLEKDVDFLKREIEQIEKRKKENISALQEAEDSFIPLTSTIKNLEDKIAQLESKFRGSVDELNQEKTALLKVENRFHTLREEIEKLKMRNHDLDFTKDILSEEKNNNELKIQELELKLKHIREDAFTHFHHDLTHDEPEKYKALSPNELTERMKRYQKRLENLGPINLAAIYEYETQKKRVKFLEEQQQDLIKSQKNLEEAIKELNTTAENLFLETFHKIEKNFSTLFKELFNGGTGKLSLVDETNPLESKIEIFANPRGKRISNINLLSSGEKALTVIALLFSIYMVKPSPFCVLDEIDAPLDEVNVTRFLSLVDKFSEQTQFIIITHNKRTVEAADNLYGITMEENGVSKIVSVKLA